MEDGVKADPGHGAAPFFHSLVQSLGPTMDRADPWLIAHQRRAPPLGLDRRIDRRHSLAGSEVGEGGMGFWRWLMFNTLGTHVLTRLKGELVGEDELGNRYYRARGSDSWRKERRWVVYAGEEPDPNLVPPGWSGWLHHRREQPPTKEPLPQPRFEKEPLPNLTGTDQAYVPPGHLRRGGRRDPATGDYEAWRP